jgi:hypothetical protein
MRSGWLALTLFGCSSSRPSVGAAAHDLGALSMPSVVTGRDGGGSVLVGARVLWMFGDTLMTVVGADGFQYRSATAAWGDRGSLALDDVLDSAGTPSQLFPYTDDERAYNLAHGPMERFALWPGSAIAATDNSGGALLFYQQLKVHPGNLNYEFISVGIARIAAGSTVAVRDPMPLFSAPERSYALAALVSNGFAYLYACDPVAGQLDTECRVVRAPVDNVASPGAWLAWDGGAWNSDRSRAQPILHGPPGDLSVSWNAHLNQFLAVYSAVFSNDVSLRTAAAPEGPWSDARKLFTGVAPPSGYDYAGKEHPELSANGGTTLVVSYAHPLGGFAGEVRAVSVVLDEPVVGH